MIDMFQKNRPEIIATYVIDSGATVRAAAAHLVSVKAPYIKI